MLKTSFLVLAFILVIVIVLFVYLKDLILYTGLKEKPIHSVPFATIPLTQFVNPFIGTAPGGSHSGFESNSGDTFPGAVYPSGMVQWSPDTPSNPPGGYYFPDTQIKGLSLTHFSGRGCQDLQDFPFMPYIGKVTISPVAHASLYWSDFSHSDETAHPGYYKVFLQGPRVETELTATLHTGLGKFVYPSSKESTMLINAAGSINGNTDAGVIIDSIAQEVTGFARSKVGCGDNPYTVYFAAKFNQPFVSFGTWKGKGVIEGSTTASGSQTGAFVTFDTTGNSTVYTQVGISFVSVANAKLNQEAENAQWDFTAVQMRADAAWNTKLNTIQVQGGTGDRKSIFYTALYHTFFHPNIFSDVNGEYLGFDNKVHTVPSGHIQYENIPGWDQYRSLIQLRAMLTPNDTSDILQSLVNDARQGDGHLPRWEQENADSHGMVGDSADAYIANGYAFGAKYFDTQGALKAMLMGQSKIREGLSDYLRLGYVSTNVSDSVSKTLEYATDDFSIAQFAKSLGTKCSTFVHQTYLNRASNWIKMFNTDNKYMQPLTANGAWYGSFNPTSGKGFTEGDSAQYSWMVPFDLPALLSKMGGSATVVLRLDNFFTNLNEGTESPYAFIGNEPSFEIPWEYDFANSPAHTQQVVRRIQLNLFKNSPNGLPGNDDAGSMSSWYIFSAIGLYPEIPGVSGFVVGSPLFAQTTIHLLDNNALLQIKAPEANDNNPYVSGLKINGKTTSDLWIPFGDIKNGANLDFTLGGNPFEWGSAVSDNPPSFTAGPATSPNLLQIFCLY